MVKLYLIFISGYLLTLKVLSPVPNSVFLLKWTLLSEIRSIDVSYVGGMYLGRYVSYQASTPLIVGRLGRPYHRQWPVPWMDQMVEQHRVSLLQSSHPSLSFMQDRWMWLHWCTMMVFSQRWYGTIYLRFCNRPANEGLQRLLLPRIVRCPFYYWRVIW